MKLKVIEGNFSVCKIRDISGVDFEAEFCFLSKTDEEISLVCTSESVPKNTLAVEDDWSAFRIEGVLDFSLIGILSEISTAMAENEIGIFAVSTYNTDYIFVKRSNLQRAVAVLKDRGYTIAK